MKNTRWEINQRTIQNQNLILSGCIRHPNRYMRVAIEGMHCQACVRRVEKAIAGVPGARPEKVEVGSAVVAADLAHEQAVLDAIRKAGYEARRTE
jgi:copper chaperone